MTYLAKNPKMTEREKLIESKDNEDG